MGHVWASVHVGVRFKAQVHHRSDGPGLLGSCHLKSGLIDQVLTRSLPNKAVDVIADKLSGDRLIFVSSTHGSLDPATRLSRLFPSTQPDVRSPSRRRSPAAHRPRQSPKVDAARPPASALPLPRLSSLRSFHHARTAAARIVVGRCRVQTVPRYSAHSPPTATLGSECLRIAAIVSSSTPRSCRLVA